jgi:hypothetical protein
MSDRRPMPRADAIEDLVVAQMRADVRAARRGSRFRPPAWSILATAAAASVAIIAVTVSLVMTPAPSFAATPPMLEISQTETTDAASLLASMSEELRASDASAPDASPDQPQHIDVQTWGLVTTVGEDGEEVLPPYVAPENNAITRYPDGSWSQVVTAGTPYDTQGDPVVDPTLPAPGTELWRADEKAGEHYYMFPSPIPEDGAELAQVMRDIGFADETSPNEWLSLVNVLLMEQVLSPAEEAAVLDVLATLDLELAGTTTDRLGREAYVFETPPSDVDLVDRVLISPSGHILAMETVYVGDDRTDIPSPAVVSYYAWEGRT